MTLPLAVPAVEHRHPFHCERNADRMTGAGLLAVGRCQTQRFSLCSTVGTRPFVNRQPNQP